MNVSNFYMYKVHTLKLKWQHMELTELFENLYTCIVQEGIQMIKVTQWFFK